MTDFGVGHLVASKRQIGTMFSLATGMMSSHLWNTTNVPVNSFVNEKLILIVLQPTS